MDVMERLFFIFLVGVSLYVGVQGMVDDAIFESKASAAITELKGTIVDQRQQIDELSIKLSNTENQFALVTNLSDDAREALAASRLAESISSNRETVEALKSIIEETPEEAITLSLLKSEIEKKQIGLTGQIDSLRGRLEEVKSYNIMLVGFLGAFLIYIIGFHFNLRSKSDKVQQGNQADD